MLLNLVNFWEVSDAVDFLSTGFVGDDEEKVFTTLKVLDEYRDKCAKETEVIDKVIQAMNLKGHEREKTLRKLKFTYDFEAITGKYELIEKTLERCDGKFLLSYNENKDLFYIQKL